MAGYTSTSKLATGSLNILNVSNAFFSYLSPLITPYTLSYKKKKNSKKKPTPINVKNVNFLYNIVKTQWKYPIFHTKSIILSQSTSLWEDENYCEYY